MKDIKIDGFNKINVKDFETFQASNENERLYASMLTLFSPETVQSLSDIIVKMEITDNEDIFICRIKNDKLNIATGVKGFLMQYTGNLIILNGVKLNYEESRKYYETIKEKHEK